MVGGSEFKNIMRDFHQGSLKKVCGDLQATERKNYFNIATLLSDFKILPLIRTSRWLQTQRPLVHIQPLQLRTQPIIQIKWRHT